MGLLQIAKNNYPIKPVLARLETPVLYCALLSVSDALVGLSLRE